MTEDDLSFHPPGPPILEMRGVHHRYGDLEVLRGLDLTIHEGEVFALLGPNGAGKTTAVEMLEGYRSPDRGAIEVFGFDPATASSTLRARIGIVLQETTAFEHMTAGETLDMFAAVYPNPIPIHEALDLVDLLDQIDKVATTMSGGQRRRLDLACGLIGRPDLLFLDEPTTGLDPQARRAIWSIVETLTADGTTVLLTTHYLEEAEALADRIGVLLGGRLAEVSTPDRFAGRDAAVATVRYDDPATGEPRAHPTSEPTMLVRELANRHGELVNLTVTRPSIEDLYLDMIRRHTTGPDGASAKTDTHIETSIEELI